MSGNERQPMTTPVLDPLNQCSDAAVLYDRLESLNQVERLKLWLHIINYRDHEPVCPTHHPGLAEKLCQEIGITALPNS